MQPGALGGGRGRDAISAAAAAAASERRSSGSMTVEEAYCCIAICRTSQVYARVHEESVEGEAVPYAVSLHPALPQKEKVPPSSRPGVTTRIDF